MEEGASGGHGRCLTWMADRRASRGSSEPVPDLLPERRFGRLLRIVGEPVDVEDQVQRIELEAVEIGGPAPTKVDDEGDDAMHLQPIPRDHELVDVGLDKTARRVLALVRPGGQDRTSVV